MTAVQILFFIIGILLLILGSGVISAHASNRFGRDLAEATETEYTPNRMSAVPLPIGFILAVASIVILVSSIPTH